MSDQRPRRRRSVYIEGFGHANPVPAACRIGHLVFSGAITGRDPATQEMPPDMDAQCRNLFAHVRAIAEASGATTADVVKMTVWLRDFRDRDALNREWSAMFPDPNDRPARQVIAATFDGHMRIQCDFIAIVGEPG